MKTIQTWMPYFTKDFLVDVAHLTCDSVGAYHLLLLHMWLRGGSLPADDDILCRLAQVRERDWARIKGEVMPFFFVDNGCWTQKRLLLELAHANDVYQKRVESARLGGRSKKATRTVSQTDIRTVPKTEPDGQPNGIANGHSNNPSGNTRKGGTITSTSTYQDSKKYPDEDIMCVPRARGQQTPSLHEVVEVGRMRGISEELATCFWHHYESQLWKSGNGLQIENWQSKLMTWKTRDQERAVKEATTKAGSSSTDFWRHMKTYEILDRQVRELANNAGRDAVGNLVSDVDRAKLRDLRAKLATEKKALGL